jgi:hypothetical protein
VRAGATDIHDAVDLVSTSFSVGIKSQKSNSTIDGVETLGVYSASRWHCYRQHHGMGRCCHVWCFTLHHIELFVDGALLRLDIIGRYVRDTRSNFVRLHLYPLRASHTTLAAVETQWLKTCSRLGGTCLGFQLQQKDGMCVVSVTQSWIADLTDRHAGHHGV